MPEEEAFCVFVKLMQDYRLRELFKPSMAELGLCMYQFESMIQVGETIQGAKGGKKKNDSSIPPKTIIYSCQFFLSTFLQSALH